MTLTSCGYDSYEECKLREQQKCGADNVACNSSAIRYCKTEFPVTNISDTSRDSPFISASLKKALKIIAFSIALLISLGILFIYRESFDPNQSEEFSWYREIWTICFSTFLFVASLFILFEKYVIVDRLVLLGIPYFGYISYQLYKYKKRLAPKESENK